LFPRKVGRTPWKGDQPVAELLFRVQNCKGKNVMGAKIVVNGIILERVKDFKYCDCLISSVEVNSYLEENVSH
jgi:hypothetical protein